MEKLTIYIARHGRTIMNTLHRSQGWCDSPLTPEGIKVAEYLGKGMRDIDLQAAYCSTLKRTYQTTQIILKAKGQEGLNIVEKEGLKEGFLGGYESHDEEEFWTRVCLFMQYTDPKEFERDLASRKITYKDITDTISKIDPWKVAEEWQTLETRTQQALKDIAEEEFQKGSKTILIVSHAMAIAAMLLSLGGDKLLKGDLLNASVCEVEYDGTNFAVKSMGDMSFVEKGKSL